MKNEELMCGASPAEDEKFWKFKENVLLLPSL
jgi:hypothetical protein